MSSTAVIPGSRARIHTTKLSREIRIWLIHGAISHKWPWTQMVIVPGVPSFSAYCHPSCRRCRLSKNNTGIIQIDRLPSSTATSSTLDGEFGVL